MTTKLTSNLRVLGVMSGTSLDGLDLALVKLHRHADQWSFEFIKSITIDYPLLLNNQLESATRLESGALNVLDKELGKFIGKQILEHFGKENIDLIASHGHTIFHQPQKSFTLQIGCGATIHQITELPVVFDFRSEDVALGGQGAPLVPVGDKLLFSAYEACLNLGGIANVSFENNNNQRVAFDILPFNMALNQLAEEVDKNYDNKGEMARVGKSSSDLLKKLNKIPYYKRPSPKSLGIEDYAEFWQPLISNNEIALSDRLHTYVNHASEVIAEELNQVLSPNATLLVTGGGAYNSYFIERLMNSFNGSVVVPNSELIEFKEALIFAFMGALKVSGINNCLSSVTGAIKDCSSGKVIGW